MKCGIIEVLIFIYLIIEFNVRIMFIILSENVGVINPIKI